MKNHPDAQIILQYGGATAFAKLLAIPSPQRVHNWMSRGIPARVKLDRPDIFPPKSSAATAPVAIKKEFSNG